MISNNNVTLEIETVTNPLEITGKNMECNNLNNYLKEKNLTFNLENVN